MTKLNNIIYYTTMTIAFLIAGYILFIHQSEVKQTCNICTKYNLDEFNDCKDVGIEDVGFLTSNHYYLCDGNKITKSCVQYGNKTILYNSSIFGLVSNIGDICQ